MYNLAIRKCTSPPLLAPRLKIFKWKFITPPGIEPRTCWTRGQATIWANATSLVLQYLRIRKDRRKQKFKDLMLREQTLGWYYNRSMDWAVGVYCIMFWEHFTWEYLELGGSQGLKFWWCGWAVSARLTILVTETVVWQDSGFAICSRDITLWYRIS